MDVSRRSGRRRRIASSTAFLIAAHLLLIASVAEARQLASTTREQVEHVVEEARDTDGVLDDGEALRAVAKRVRELGVPGTEALLAIVRDGGYRWKDIRFLGQLADDPRVVREVSLLLSERLRLSGREMERRDERRPGGWFIATSRLVDMAAGLPAHAGVADELLRFMRRRPSDPPGRSETRLRRSVCAALGRIGGDEVEALLVRVATDPRDECAGAAQAALLKTPHRDRYGPVFLRLLPEADPRFARTTVLVLSFEYLSESGQALRDFVALRREDTAYRDVVEIAQHYITMSGADGVASPGESSANANKTPVVVGAVAAVIIAATAFCIAVMRKRS